MFLISDNVDTYTGMRLAGVDGVVVHERKELREQLEKVLQDKSIGIVLLTEKFGQEFPDILDEFRLERKIPLLIEIPDRHGTGRKRLYHLIHYRSHRAEIVRQKFLKEEILLTLEEKITHLRTTSMEEARAESNAVIDSYRDALEKVFEDHKIEAKRQMQTRIKAETVNARQQKNQAMARTQLDLKRRQGRIEQELKDKIFEEAYTLVKDYMKTGEYNDFLIRCIHNAIMFQRRRHDDLSECIRRRETFFSGRCNRYPPDHQRRRFYRRYPGSHPQPQYSDRSFF